MSGTTVATPGQGSFVGGGLDVGPITTQLILGNQLLAKIQQAIQTISFRDPPSYTVAGLPTTGNSAGAYAWASNGRLPGQGSGAGTGCPIFWNAATSQWYSFLSGAQITA